MRKPIALLAAGSMMLMPLLGAASVVLTPVSEAYAETADSTASDYPEGVTAYLDGTRLASFDPSGNGDVYDATGQTVELSGVPDDWTVQWSSRVNEITNKDSIMYILSNGSTTYRYWFDGAEGAVHTVEELHGMTITLNGQAVDGDITQGFTIHDVTAGDMKGYENVPYGWVLDGDSEDDHYTYTAHPNDSDTPSVQYTFLYDDTRPHDSINSLRNLKAYLTVDGSAVKGFDYTLANTDTIAIPMNADVRLEGVPDGWKVDYNNPSTGQRIHLVSVTVGCGLSPPGRHVDDGDSLTVFVFVDTGLFRVESGNIVAADDGSYIIFTLWKQSDGDDSSKDEKVFTSDKVMLKAGQKEADSP
ncbi:hypothetical protein, partial [Bifidobacterium adolescentis]|uniref:hypothetical protein n=1 Tax=Bifidobacterium adolescentis TaxID=1680 RepID=UPI0040634B64